MLLMLLRVVTRRWLKSKGDFLWFKLWTSERVAEQQVANGKG